MLTTWAPRSPARCFGPELLPTKTEQNDSSASNWSKGSACHDPRTNDGPRLILIDFAVSGGFERQYRVLPVTLSCSGSRMASLGGIACNRRESRWS